MRFTRTLLTILFVALTLNISFSGTSWALLDKLLGKKQPAATAKTGPQHPIHDEETFKAGTKSFHLTPFNDMRLEFDILLPQDWTPEPIPVADNVLQQRILGDLAQFQSPYIGTQQAHVVIQALNLEHEISAENWLKNYLFMSGYVLQGEVIPDGKKKASASFIYADDSKSLYNYAVAQISGSIVVIARFESPLSMKDYFAFLRERTVKSFRLINTTMDPVEQSKDFLLTDAVKFDYPISWKSRYSDLADTYNQYVQLHNETLAGRIEGVIRIAAIKRTPQTNLMDEISKMKNYFETDMGLEIKSLVSSDKARVYDRFLFSRYEIYRVAYKKKDTDVVSANAAKQKAKPDQELRFVALGDKEWYVFAFLLTPQKQNNLYNWARNTETFDLILERMR